MIQPFVQLFENNKDKLRASLATQHPGSYAELVKSVVEILHTDDYGSIDPARIHSIDDGDYQGTLVFVIAASGYQPYDYWYVKVSYGSCSGCDTLQSISGYSDSPPNEEQINDYMTLALHIVQGLKLMGEDEA